MGSTLSLTIYFQDINYIFYEREVHMGCFIVIDKSWSRLGYLSK